MIHGYQKMIVKNTSKRFYDIKFFLTFLATLFQWMNLCYNNMSRGRRVGIIRGSAEIDLDHCWIASWVGVVSGLDWTGGRVG